MATVVSEEKPKGRRAKFHLRALLLYVNLIILILPITGFWMLRVYENELARRTEGELLAQSAFLREAFLLEVERERRPGDPVWSEPAMSHEPAPHLVAKLRSKQQFRHIPSTIDLNRVKLLDPAPDPREIPDEDNPPDILVRAGERISQLMQGTQAVTLAGMRIVDHKGVVVASSRGQIGLSLKHRDEVASALMGEYTRLVRRRISDSPKPSLNSLSRRSSVRLFVALPIVVEGRVAGAVITSRTPLSLTRALYDNRQALIILAVSQLIAVLLLSLYTSRTIVRPVHQLIAQAHELERGATEAKVLQQPVTREVEMLSEAIVQMARALKDRSDYIKTFASNVSHEFKTPLTSIRGTVELLQDHLETMDTEQREKFLGIIDRDAERLHRLVNRLLELARADVFEPDKQLSEPAKLLEQVVARYAVDGLDIELTQDASAEQARVQMASVTLESILANLLDNARQHGGEDVSIKVKLERKEGFVRIEVSDQGPGISEANRQKIFKPFFTTARPSGGTGLGLSVVASLLQAHAGDIELLPDLPTTFRITLPDVGEEASA